MNQVILSIWILSILLSFPSFVWMARSSFSPVMTKHSIRSLPRRHSLRLLALQASSDPGRKGVVAKTVVSKKTASTRQAVSAAKTKAPSREKAVHPKETDTICLPRTREKALLKEGFHYVVGIDEAGRGPLAGPVVAAAAWVPADIPGIIDSKKLTNEYERERLYEEIVGSKGTRWAVAVVDAPRIDEINILQATMQAMCMSCNALVEPTLVESAAVASVDRHGCYVVVGGSDLDLRQATKKSKKRDALHEKCYALVDGNRLPTGLLVDGEPMVKGDGKEYAIAAASILAKVTRDRLMNAYHDIYPAYNLIQHKGYPTKAHMAAVHKHGATPIHRRTFAPLKHMEFDKDGKVIR